MPPSNSTTLRDQRSIGSAAAATPIVEVDDQLRFAREFKVAGGHNRSDRAAGHS